MDWLIVIGCIIVGLLVVIAIYKAIFYWVDKIDRALDDIHRIADALDDYVYDDEEEVGKSEIEKKE